MSKRPPEDPAVALVETILSAGAVLDSPTPFERKRFATNALWLCACASMDDAPVWLIYDSPVDGLHWCRLPNDLEMLDLVDPQSYAGGHVDPGRVLLWLEGKADDPSGNGGWISDDPVVFGELRRRIRGS